VSLIASFVLAVNFEFAFADAAVDLLLSSPPLLVQVN
jgi:hypothetical protein